MLSHFLLQVDQAQSKEILTLIQAGDLRRKPGWVRFSIHPNMTNTDVTYILDAIEWTATHRQEWMAHYRYDRESNQYVFQGSKDQPTHHIQDWFRVTCWGELSPLS